MRSHLSLVSSSAPLTTTGDDLDDDAILAYWATWAAASGYRPRTVKENVISLRAALRRTGKTILTMTRFDLIGDLGREGISPHTRQRYKSLFFGFWTWVQDEGFRLDCPAVRLPSVRIVKGEPTPVTTADLERLINSGVYAKTRMYVLLYAYQGFRASEIAAVSGENIDWQRRLIKSVDGKGGKVVWRPLHPLVWAEAQKYPRCTAWFPSPNGVGHVSGGNVSTVLSRAMKRAGITGHRPHNLRGWYATEMSAAGASTAVVAAGLRHADLQSVDRYLSVPLVQVAVAQDRLPVVSVPDRVERRRAA